MSCMLLVFYTVNATLSWASWHSIFEQIVADLGLSPMIQYSYYSIQKLQNLFIILDIHLPRELSLGQTQLGLRSRGCNSLNH